MRVARHILKATFPQLFLFFERLARHIFNTHSRRRSLEGSPTSLVTWSHIEGHIVPLGVLLDGLDGVLHHLAHSAGELLECVESQRRGQLPQQLARLAQLVYHQRLVVHAVGEDGETVGQRAAARDVARAVQALEHRVLRDGLVGGLGRGGGGGGVGLHVVGDDVRLLR
eukprot:5618464-Pyramimonas_sp.AAC.1